MSRLIDADSLLQVIRKNIPKNPHDEYQEGQEIGLSMAVEMVCNEPTVDAEPVIRCKDCKYCEDESYTDEDTGKEVKYLVCDRWYEQDDADGNMFPKADDFCSKGERKDD